MIRPVPVQDNDIRHAIQRLSKGHERHLYRKDRSETPSRSERGIAAELDGIAQPLLGEKEERLA